MQSLSQGRQSAISTRRGGVRGGGEGVAHENSHRRRSAGGGGGGGLQARTWYFQRSQ